MSLCALWLAVLLHDAGYETVVTDRRGRDAAADATVLAVDDAPLAVDGIASTLQQIPGLQLTRLGGLGSPLWVGLRGSTTAQVAVLVDGVPLGGLAESTVDLNALPWGDIERMEVYRGVSPLQFGIGVMGGVLAFTTAVPRQDSARVGLGYGSFNTFGGDAQGAVTLGEEGVVHGGLHTVTSDGDFWFRSDGGTAFTSVNNRDVQRINNAVVQLSAMLGGQWQRGTHRVRAWLWALDAQRGVPSSGVVQARNTHVHNQELTGQVTYRHLLPNLGSYEVQVYAQGVAQNYLDPNAEVVPYPSDATDHAGLAGARFYGTWRLLPAWQLSAVAMTRFETFHASDTLAKPNDASTATRWQSSAGLDSDVALGPVHVVPAVLWEGAFDQRAGRDPFGHFESAQSYQASLWQGRLGAYAAITDSLTARANAARYSRVPSALELYGDAHGVLGNTALLPESGYNGDMGVTWARPDDAMPWRADLTAFASISQDLIVFEQNAAGQSRAFNLGRARVLGADVAGQIAFTPWLALAAQATFMDARDISDTPTGRAMVPLPARPRWHVLGQPRFTWGPVRAYADVDFADGLTLDPAGLVALPDRLLFGASVVLRVSELDIGVRGQNLADARVFDVAGFPLPSRSLMLTLRWQGFGETS